MHKENLFKMQQSILVLLALLLAPAAAIHDSPTEDQLADVKSSDPNSYAMVSALLKKQSMGLIKLAPSERGPDAFKRMMPAAKHSEAAQAADESPYAEEAVHKVFADPNAYNPQATADKDEQSVNSMLEAVANLGGNKGKKMALLKKRHHLDKTTDSDLEASDPFSKDAALFGLNEYTLHDSDSPAAANQDQAEVAPQQAEVAPVQHQAVVAQVAPTETKAKTNSYLKGLNLDLSGDFPDSQNKAPRKARSENLLDTFNYNLEAAVLEPKAEEAPKPEESVTPATPKPPVAFLKYLGMTKKAPAPEEAAAAQPANKASESNPYDVFAKSLLDD